MKDAEFNPSVRDDPVHRLQWRDKKRVVVHVHDFLLQLTQTNACKIALWTFPREVCGQISNRLVGTIQKKVRQFVVRTAR